MALPHITVSHLPHFALGWVEFIECVWQVLETFVVRCHNPVYLYCIFYTYISFMILAFFSNILSYDFSSEKSFTHRNCPNTRGATQQLGPGPSCKRRRVSEPIVRYTSGVPRLKRHHTWVCSLSFRQFLIQRRSPLPLICLPKKDICFRFFPASSRGVSNALWQPKSSPFPVDLRQGYCSLCCRSLEEL